MTEPRPTLRIDKWLWFARFFKTRGLAAKQASGGHVRVNGTKITKASYSLGADDVLTFVQGNQVRVVRVLALGTRRGPAPEAQELFEDLSPPPEPRDAVPPAPKYEGKGRPTKKDRRNARLSKRDMLE